MIPQNKLRVLLVADYQDSAIMYNTTAPPLGLFRLRHHLQKHDIDCDVCDLGLIAEDLNSNSDVNTDKDFGKFSALIDHGHYDIIGVSLIEEHLIHNISMTWDLRRKIEKLDKPCLLIAGGQSATHNCDLWIKEGSLDAVLFGFAENTLRELCVRFSDNRDKHISLLGAEMDGLAYPDLDGNIIHKPQRSFTQNEFHELNFINPMEMDVPYEVYWDCNRGEGAEAKLNLKQSEDSVDTQKFYVETVRVYTSSHCSWKCGFCNSQSFLKASGNDTIPIYRLTPGEIHQLIIRNIKKYNPKVFLFNDDAFIDGSRAGEQHILELCNLIITSKEAGEIHKDVLFNCQARVADFIIKKPVKMVNQSVMDALLKAGFYHFGLGIETFSDNLLHANSINKKAVTEKESNMVINWQLAAGMSPSLNIILFVPEATVDELVYVMKAVAGWLIKGCQVSLTPLLRANPGSRLYDKIKSGVSDVEIEWGDWLNPNTNRRIRFPIYCKPNDPKLRAIIDQFKIREFNDMQQMSKPEYDRILRNLNWDQTIVPRPIQALSVFLTVSKLLKRNDLVDYFEEAVNEICGRNQQYYKKVADITNQKLKDMEAREGLVF